MPTLSPATVKKVAIGAAVLMALVILSVTVGRWWNGQRAAYTEQIAGLQAAITARDVRIKARDAQLAALRHQDSVLAETVVVRTAKLASAKTDLAEAERAIDAQAAQTQLVPLPAVHSIELKADVAVASCESVNAALSTRVDSLLSQIANQAATRADLDTNATAQTTILKDTVSILKPPWFRRFLGWVDDHAITLVIGAVGGFILAKH